MVRKKKKHKIRYKRDIAKEARRLSREVIGDIPPTKVHKVKKKYSRKGRRKVSNWREYLDKDN